MPDGSDHAEASVTAKAKECRHIHVSKLKRVLGFPHHPQGNDGKE